MAVLTCDPSLLRGFWLDEYAPEVIETEASRYPSIADLTEGLGGRVTADGTWDRRHGHLRDEPSFTGSLVIVSSPARR